MLLVIRPLGSVISTVIRVCPLPVTVVVISGVGLGVHGIEAKLCQCQIVNISILCKGFNLVMSSSVNLLVLIS